MDNDHRRITLIARHPGTSDRAWDESTRSGSHLIFVDSPTFLPFALDRGITDLGQDVERVIIDQTGTAVQFLELLSALPYEFVGDLLFVRGDESGFLSSIGRGGDRVLYSLAALDVRFYLETQSLLLPQGEAVMPAPRVASA